jgi:hypothetical protein
MLAEQDPTVQRIYAHTQLRLEETQGLRDSWHQGMELRHFLATGKVAISAANESIILMYLDQ